jgi:hypothetical protein
MFKVLATAAALALSAREALGSPVSVRANNTLSFALNARFVAHGKKFFGVEVDYQDFDDNQRMALLTSNFGSVTPRSTYVVRRFSHDSSL